MSNEVAISLISGSFGLVPMIIQTLSSWIQKDKQDFQNFSNLSIARISRQTYSWSDIQLVIRTLRIIEFIAIAMILRHVLLLSRIITENLDDPNFQILTIFISVILIYISVFVYCENLVKLFKNMDDDKTTLIVKGELDDTFNSCKEILNDLNSRIININNKESINNKEAYMEARIKTFTIPFTNFSKVSLSITSDNKNRDLQTICICFEKAPIEREYTSKKLESKSSNSKYIARIKSCIAWMNSWIGFIVSLLLPWRIFNIWLYSRELEKKSTYITEFTKYFL